NSPRGCAAATGRSNPFTPSTTWTCSCGRTAGRRATCSNCRSTSRRISSNAPPSSSCWPRCGALRPASPMPRRKPVSDQANVDGNLDDPAGRLEIVRTVWREVLDLEDVADDTSFFDAGGDSLRLVILVERLNEATGRALKTIDLFRAGTV